MCVCDDARYFKQHKHALLVIGEAWCQLGQRSAEPHPDTTPAWLNPPTHPPISTPSPHTHPLTRQRETSPLYTPLSDLTFNDSRPGHRDAKLNLPFEHWSLWPSGLTDPLTRKMSSARPCRLPRPIEISVRPGPPAAINGKTMGGKPGMEG